MRLVQKFGGTSVATIDRIKNVANLVAESKFRNSSEYKKISNKEKEIVVVVSAMAGVTNQLINTVNSLGVTEGYPEYDTVVSSGELITAGLTAIALENIGIKSKSYASWQVPILTDNNYGRAIIQNINATSIEKDLEEGIVPVICGFQGVSPEKKITTLGRGGSDLTAVAVASAIKADLCEIYSDVDGVYTVDPNLYSGAKIIDKICYDEMLEMASQGAKVLQGKSVLYAKGKNVIIRVASSFIKSQGTIISSEVSEKPFCGMAVVPSISQLQISSDISSNISELQNLKNRIKCFLSEQFIECDLLSEKNKIVMLVDKAQSSIALELLNSSGLVCDVKHKLSRSSFSKISVIGSSITKSSSENIKQNFIRELEKNKINLLACIPYERKLNFIIAREQFLEAISILHKYCELDKLYK